MEPLSSRDWYNLANEKYALRIKDILALNTGDQLKLLVLDRNVGDTFCRLNDANVVHDPEFFFRGNTATYTHGSDGGSHLKGEMTFHWDTLGDKTYTQELEIEYDDDGSYYPLRDDYLPAIDPQGFAQFSWSSPQHFSSFSPETRVGWRGPMVRCEDVKNMPKIYWKENN